MTFVGTIDLVTGLAQAALGIAIMVSSTGLALPSAAGTIADLFVDFRLGIGLYGVVGGTLIAALATGLLLGSPPARILSVALSGLRSLSLLPLAAVLTFVTPAWALVVWVIVIADLAAIWLLLTPGARDYFEAAGPKEPPPPFAFWSLLVLVVAAIIGIGFLTLQWTQRYGGVPAEAWRILVTQPLNLDRVISIIAVALVPATLVLAPIAIAETRAVRAFERAEARIRLMWPEAVVTPYDGEEGQGLAFDAPELRVLLLRPEAGIGEPRVVNLAPVAPPPRAGDERPTAGDERTSPMGS